MNFDLIYNNMRIDRFNNFKKLKTKEELDQLSENEVDEYRRYLLNQKKFNQSYLNELDIYQEIRFEHNKKFLIDLVQKEIDGELSDDKTIRKTQELLLRVIKRNNGDVSIISDSQLKDAQKNVGVPKYIFM